MELEARAVIKFIFQIPCSQYVIMSIMKRLLYFLFLLLSFIFFLALVFLSSPYRELRPYNIFGKKITENLHIQTRMVNNRLTIYIPGNDAVSGFYIDQIPVTVDSYKDCINNGLCETQHYRGDYTKFWGQKIFGSFPVTFVTWMEALNYCHAYGGDLPSALQWELAAGYGMQHHYPWNNTLPSLSKANLDGFYQLLTPAGWLPEGASPYGVLDMSGNVREWMLDEVFEYNDNKMLKGGGANDSFSDGRIEASFDHAPTSSGFNRGFRCVYPN